ncbi:LysR family transcriptional regulator [uncultured Martelella sp.]|uniref:LysR family transcriptional regulator n=1 Tax=uncultured Martelella sp. TaxID=392331 RepID=UPI0029C9076A|nr:LysR family transcriptional regulator [uncultured Martelella sp.]
MDLALLEDFIELAKEKSFSRAAEARNLTQPAFSRRIKTLEDVIGTQLVQRTSRSVSLTPAGTAFQPRADAIVRLFAEARSEALEIAGLAETGLNLAATHALSYTFVPKWLMQAIGPSGIGTLNMISDTQGPCVRAMLRGEANFLVCHRDRSAAFGLSERQFRHHVIGHDRLVPLCMPDTKRRPRWHLGHAKGPVPFIAYGNPSGIRNILEHHWSLHGRPALSVSMSSVLAAANLELAKEGHGVAFLPLSLAETAVAQGELVRAANPDQDIPVEIVIYRPRSKLSKHSESFWEKVQNFAP